MRASTYRLFHVDKILSGFFFVGYIYESAPAADCKGMIYVEDVRSLATKKGIPLIIITYTAPDNIRKGWKPDASRRPQDAEYMHNEKCKSIRSHLFFMSPLDEEIIVPYTRDGINKRLDALQNFKEMVPDDLRERIGDFLGAQTAPRRELCLTVTV